MNIFQNSLGMWVLHVGATFRYFDSQQEAMIAMAKLNTAKAIVSAVQALAATADDAADLEAEYFDVGTWVDDDVAPLGITADNLASCLTLLQQFDKLMTNQATTPAVYRSTLNKVRRVTA